AAILRATYDYSTSYWLYAKRNQVGRGQTVEFDAAVEHIIDQAQSEDIIGPNGPLQSLGLVPLPLAERTAPRASLATTSGPFGLMSFVGWMGSLAADTWNMF